MTHWLRFARPSQEDPLHNAEANSVAVTTRLACGRLVP